MGLDFKDYYATLGVARDASADDVKKAFRKLARKFHPDVSKEPDAEARMKEINEANAVLSDPEKRAAYDQAGRGHSAGQAFHPPPDWDAGFEFQGDGHDGADHSAFFEQLFGRMAREQAHGRGFRASARDGRGEDHHAKVMLDLADAWGGVTRQVSLRVPQLDAQGHLVLVTRTLNVRIPKGVRAGQLIRLAGQGAPGFDAAAAGAPGSGAGKPGDLLLEVQFRPHPQFHLDGGDLLMTLPAAPWECALGATVPVTLPDGGKIEVRIPGGAQGGTQLRVRGKGLPGEPPGDLLLRIEVHMPPANTARARELYETMARELAFDARVAAGEPA